MISMILWPYNDHKNMYQEYVWLQLWPLHKYAFIQNYVLMT